MANAKTSRTQLAYVVESTYGTTPASPSMVLLPRTGGVPNLQKESFKSATINSNRQASDMRHGYKSASLSMACELAPTDFDPLLESVMYSSFATNVLKVGTTEKSMSVEGGFLDVAQYAMMTGGIVNTASFSIKPSGMVDTTFDFVGKTLSYSGTPANASPTASSTDEPFDSFSGSINEGGSSIATVTGLDFSISNNIEGSKTVGTDESAEQFEGMAVITGTLTAYFADASLVNKFVNETGSSLDVTLSNPAGDTLKFDMGNILYTGGELDIGGTAVTLSLPFEALYNVADASALVITRS